MIKKISATIFVLGIALFGSATAETKIARNAVIWQPIIGLNVPGVKGFIDVNNVKVNTLESGQYNSVEVLFSYDTPITVNTDNTDKVIGSMVRSVIIKCESGLTAPVYDLFFEDSMPTGKSLYLTMVDYTRNPQEHISYLKKSSILYKALCPRYI